MLVLLLDLSVSVVHRLAHQGSMSCEKPRLELESDLWRRFLIGNSKFQNIFSAYPDAPAAAKRELEAANSIMASYDPMGIVIFGVQLVDDDDWRDHEVEGVSP